MSRAETDRFFVLTGGPGSGKTTLIEALARSGIVTMPEAGRSVIQDAVACGGTALPWADRLAFAAAMHERDMHAHQALSCAGPVVFDRGIPDVVGYLRLTGLPVPDAIGAAALRHRYNCRVFVTPPWPAIYAQDAERRQSFAEAEATYRTMVKVYSELGYVLIPVPMAAIDERVRFVRSAIGGGGEAPSPQSR